MDLFEDSFRITYWQESIQCKVKFNLLLGKFQEGGKLTMYQYFIVHSKSNIAKHLK